MARYCFYCGLEIAPGKKCGCRYFLGDKSFEASNSSENGARNRSEAQQTGKRCTSVPKSNKRRPQSSRTKRPSFRWKTFTDQLRTLFPTFASGAISASGYFLRPASKIRQESLKAKRPSSLINALLFSLCTGLLGIVLLHSRSHLFVVMLESILGTDALLFCIRHPFAGFGILSLIATVALLVLTLIFFLASRFANRKPTFRKIFDLVSISLVYVQVLELILLISTLLGAKGSISFLFVSVILMGLAQLLAFRSALNLAEDTVFLMIIFAYTGAYLIFKFLFFLLAVIAFPN